MLIKIIIMLPKSLQSKTSKKQAFLEKLKSMDEENQKLQSQILRAISTAKISLTSEVGQGRNIVVDVMKMMRKMNQKTIMEKRKNKRIYNAIKEGVLSFKESQDRTPNTIATQKYQEAIRAEAKKYEDLLKDKDEMIEVLKNQLFAVNEKVRNLQSIIEQNEMVREQEIRRRRHTYVVQTENMTEKLQKLLIKREGELQKAKKILDSRVKQLEEEKKFAIQMQSQNQNLRIEIVKQTELKNSREIEIKNERIKLLQHIESLIKERKEFQEEMGKKSKNLTERQKLLKQLQAKLNEILKKAEQQNLEIGEKDQRIEQLTSQTNSRAADLQKVQAQLETVMKDLDLARLKQKEQNNLVEELRRLMEIKEETQSNQKTRIGQLQEEVRILGQDLKSQDEKIQLKQEEIESLQKKLNESEVKLQQVKNMIEEMGQLKQAATKQIEAKDTHIKQLQINVYQLEQQSQQHKQSHELLQKQLEQFKATIIVLTEKLTQTQLQKEQAKKKNEQIGNYQKQLQVMRIQATGARQNQEKQKLELISLAQQIQDLQTQLQTQAKLWQQKEDQWKQAQATMETEINSLTARQACLNQKTEELAQKIHQLQAKIQRSEEQNLQARSQKQKQEAENSILLKQIAELGKSQEKQQILIKQMIAKDAKLVEEAHSKQLIMLQLESSNAKLSEANSYIEAVKLNLSEESKTILQTKMLYENKVLEVNQLREQRSRFEQKIEQLKSSVSQRDRQLEHKNAQLQEWENRGAELTKQMHELQAQAKQKEGVFMQKMIQLEEKSKAVLERDGAMQEQERKYAGIVGKLTEELEAQRNQYTALESKHDQQSRKWRQTQDCLKQESGRLQKISAENLEISSSLQQSNQQLCMLGTKCSELESTHEKQLVLKNLQISRLQNSLRQVEGAASELEEAKLQVSTISQLQALIQLNKQSIQDKDCQIKQKEQQNQELRAQLANSFQNLSTLKQKIAGIQNRIEQQSRFLDSTQNQNKELRISLQLMESASSEKERALIKNNTELNQKLQESAAELKVLCEEKQQLRLKLNQFQIEIGKGLELTQECNKLELKIIAIQDELVKKQKEILEMSALSEKQQLKIHQLQLNLDEAHVKLAELAERYEAEKEKNKILIQTSQVPAQQQFDNAKQDIQNVIKTNLQSENQQNPSQSSSSVEVQTDQLRKQLELEREKYQRLQKLYHSLQKQMPKKIQKRQFGTQTEGIVQQSPVLSEQQAQQNRLRNNSSNVSETSFRMALGDEPFFRAVRNNEVRLDISLPPDQQQFLKGLNRNSTSPSPMASFFNLNAFFTQYESHNKIQNFNYSNSIIYKINSSKYITNPESKVAFIFQYACFLELYFSKQFLSSIRSELVMGEELTAKTIRSQDLNLELVEIGTYPQENSFSSQSQSSSKISNSNKFYVANQFSMNTLSKVEGEKKKSKMNYSFNVFSESMKATKLEKNEKMKIKLEKIQQELMEIKMFLSQNSVQAKNLRKYPEILKKIEQLKGNQIAQMLIKLIKENEGLQKCLDQMMENEEMITNTNNESYFEEKEQETAEPEKNVKRQSTLSMEILKFITSDKKEEPKQKIKPKEKEKQIEQSSKDTYKSSENESDLEKKRDPKAAEKQNCAIM